ncbi:hypothetical protein BCR42DRAFT_397289 [Absidia repens]|uniref:Uncharacterized protein n=1 Tax=Absidia repens TaxID=90262 RepID=A0A1X2I1J1_9FUNG|nr:hypothetical protein BCR42DRAFT_397289 [Absidia repens]
MYADNKVKNLNRIVQIQQEPSSCKKRLNDEVLGNSFPTSCSTSSVTDRPTSINLSEGSNTNQIRLLENDDSFIQQMWTEGADGLAYEGMILLDIIRYILWQHSTWFSAMCLFSTQNHERTPFIENIVPSLLSLSKITGMVEFEWCETEFTSSKYLDLMENDYNQRPGNFGIEDYLKLLECGISPLAKEVVSNKESTTATFKKLKVFSIQVIKNQVTLSELYMHDPTSWCFVEKRTSTLPSSWNDRLLLIPYLELVATLFDDLCESQHVLKSLMKENLGLVSGEGPCVETMFDDN